MSWHKQDFERIAEIIEQNTIKDGVMFQSNTWQVATQLADLCESKNGAFDRERFLKACGVRQ